MAKQFPQLEPDHRAFIARQRLFFTASGAAHGHLNLSPKGLGGFRVIDERTVCYLDLTGSGAETSAHLSIDGRLTLMFCAFEGPPLILRLYGTGVALNRGTPEYARLLADLFDGDEPPGARQIIVQDIALVQTSCGWGVPAYDYKGERPGLVNWASQQGDEGLDDYRRRKNAVSLNGWPTGLFEDAIPAE